MSNTSRHPTFSNPTLREAFCELHFALPTARPWSAQWFGELFKSAQAEYPRMEPREISELGVGVRPDGIVQRVRAGGIRMMYHHAQRPHLLQLSDSVLTINELRPYPGWDRFAADIERGMSLLALTVQPVEIRRIGLRYINHIPRADTEEPISEWLAASPYLPEAVRGTAQRFHVRLQIPLARNQRLVLNLAEVEHEGASFLLLDLDAILFQSLPCEADAIRAQIDPLHESIWRVFSSCMSPRLRAHLQEMPRVP